MRKIGALLLAVFMVFTLVACNSTQGESSSQTKTTSQSATDETKEQTNSDTTAKGKVLVVYFSATGSTEKVAKAIAETSDATLFEIEPKKPYSSDDLNYNDDNSRVSREHNNPDLQNVELTSTSVPNWDSYDPVVVGYPIWWGDAAWPVSTFVKANNFDGKTVIPFCTSASSDIGDSGKNLADLAKTGDWQTGRRFSSSADTSEVKAWVTEFGL